MDREGSRTPVAALKQFNTRLPVEQTVGEIHQLLADHGVRRIQSEYDGAGRIVAITFELPVGRTAQYFRLPVRPERVYRLLEMQHEQGIIDLPSSLVSMEHAARVAWRHIYDWIAAQVTLAETEQISLDEALSPYMLAKGTTVTVYDIIRERVLALPDRGDSHPTIDAPAEPEA